MPHVTHQSCRNRQRNIIWFNPPFSKNIKTNIARNFLNLVDTHFPAGHKLHKIFNRNTVKVSYSCMNNVKNIISKHNTRIIRKSQPKVTNTTSCNCRNKETCPLQKQVHEQRYSIQGNHQYMQHKRHETLHKHDFKHI